MDWDKELYNFNEKPLDRLCDGYSNTSIFRKIGFIGDSLSSGEFETRSPDGTRGYHDFYEYSWGQYIARKNGLTAYNFSKGGMTAKEYCESFAEEKGFWAPELACQAYVIALGVNEHFRDHEIGTSDDVDVENYRNNKETTAGFYGQIISRYKEISPEAKFFFVTLPNDDRLNEEKRVTFEKVLYDFTEKFDNSYVIDLYKYGPVYDDNFRQHFYLHGHLDPSGYILTARLIDAYIDYIVRHNPDDFHHTGLVLSDVTDR